MPRIPRGSGEIPSAGPYPITPEQAGSLGRARAESIGGGLSRLGATGSEVAIAFQRERQEQMRRDAETQAIRGFLEADRKINAELRSNPGDGSDYVSRYRASMDTYISQMLEGVQDKVARTRITERILPYYEKKITEADTTAYGIQRDNSFVQRDAARQELKTQAILATDPVARDLAVENLRKTIYENAYTTDLQKEFLFKSDMTDVGLGIIESLEPEAALQVLRDPGALPMLKGEVRARLIEAEEKEIEVRNDASLRQKKSDAKARIAYENALFTTRVDRAEANGEDPNELDTLADIQHMSTDQYGNRLMPDEKYNEMKRKIQSYREKLIGDRDDLLLVSDAMEGKIVLSRDNPEHARAVNLAWNKAKPVIDALQDPQERINQRVRFFLAMNQFPKDYKADFTGQLEGGSPEKVYEMTEDIMRTLAHNPRMRYGWNDKEIRAIHSINKRGAVRGAEQSVIDWRERDKVPELEMKYREDEIKDIINTESLNRSLEDRTEDEYGFFKARVIPDPDPVQIEMFHAMIKEEYTFNPDLDVAEKTAYERWRKQFGITNIGGNSDRWMMRPPDDFYNVPGVDNEEWMNKQLVDELREFVPKESAYLDDDELLDRLVLASDELTMRQVYPDYAVFWIDDLGQLVPLRNYEWKGWGVEGQLPERKRGTGFVRWAPDMIEAGLLKKLEEERAEAIAESEESYRRGRLSRQVRISEIDESELLNLHPQLVHATTEFLSHMSVDEDQYPTFGPGPSRMMEP